jgi:hypothetical protein
MLFVAEATSKGSTPLFFMKLGFVAVGVTTLRLIQQRMAAHDLDQAAARGSARTLAIVSLAAWVAAITAGRLLAYVAT